MTAIVVALSVESAQGATTDVLEPIGAQTVVSAYAGHIVWNELDLPTGRWYLRHRFGDTTARLPVPSRSVPFDVDVGPDRRGAAVAAYSRCTREPDGAGVLVVRPDWTRAAGCDIYRTDLARGRERRVRGVSSRRGSETTPSIWAGSIAFARRYPGRRKTRIYFRRAGRARLVRIPGGTTPRCVGRCSPRPHGGVEALDLGRRSLAYLWTLVNGNVVGTGVGWEVRTVGIGQRRAVLAASGFVGGACGFALPTSPQADRAGVTYLERIGECLTVRTSFVRFDRRTRRWRAAATPGGFGYALGRDGTTYYWIRGRVPEPENAPAFDPCRVSGNCALVRSGQPSFGPPQRRKVTPPTF